MLLLLRTCVALAGCGVMPGARAFDSGHHWELTSQTLLELGFSEDARQTACVSNWLLDYYSSSPTGSKKLREELSKLHCDNLPNAAAARHYQAHFMSNAKAALTALGDGEESDRETLLMLGAVLHVVQDFYSHSNWPELHSSQDTLSNRTWFSARGRLPPEFLTGAYNPRPYVAGTMPLGHPVHGSYEGGLHKDAHDRPWWPQAYFLAYCASREFVEAFRTWIPRERWQRLCALRLNPLENLRLKQEVKAAYGISLWIKSFGEHGHWKCGGSGHGAMFLGSAFSFVTMTSHNALWYRVKKGYRPLIEGLYDMAKPPPSNAAGLVPGRSLRRTAIMLRVARAQQTGRSLDQCISGQPDFYLVGGVYYGNPALSTKPSKLRRLLEPEGEPESMFDERQLNVLFRDRVIQEASTVESPWKMLVIADDKLLADNQHGLTFFLEVGEEDLGNDDVADISPVPGKHVLAFYCDLKRSRLTIAATGQSFAIGRGETISVRGDDHHSVELKLEIYTMPAK